MHLCNIRCVFPAYVATTIIEIVILNFTFDYSIPQLGYTKKQEERHFRGVITLEVSITVIALEKEKKRSSSEIHLVYFILLVMVTHLIIITMQECNIEEIPDEEDAPPPKSSKDKKANGPDAGKAPSLVFKITSKVPYKTVLKGMSFFLQLVS